MANGEIGIGLLATSAKSHVLYVAASEECGGGLDSGPMHDADAMSGNDALRQRLRAAEQALDGIQCAVFILNAQASIVFANCAARALLEAGDALYRCGPTLTARVNGDAAALRAVIVNVGAATSAVVRPRAIAIRRDFSRAPLVVVAVPTAPRSARDPGPRQVLLYVVDPGRQSYASSALLRESLGLTGREIGVALATLRLNGLPAAARELRIAPSTARSHLQHVFEKTGARNQVALAQMLGVLGELPRADDAAGHIS